MQKDDNRKFSLFICAEINKTNIYVMKTSALTSILIILFGINLFSQPMPSDSLYLGQTPPGTTPKIFSLAVIPGFFAAERIAISADGKDVYYQELNGYYAGMTVRIKKYSFSGNHWTGPSNLFENYVSPALSSTNDTMYVENQNKPYSSFRNGTNWSQPKRAFSSLAFAHYLQVTDNGNYYASSMPASGIGAADWCRIVINGTDTSAVSLGLPLNTTGDDLDFFVSRDDSFMIISWPAGLCISYHNSNGSWTNPKNLGPVINWGLGMWGPYVSSDSKYLFYSTGTKQNYSDTYVYWARIDGLIDSLKHTNFIPYVKIRTVDQTDTAGHPFTYAIPDSSFVDDDGNNTLTYDAKQTNGNPLPSWLKFDPATRIFSGTPKSIETLNIRLKATDNAGASASTTLKITVKAPTNDSLYLGQVPPGNTPKVFNLAVSAGFFTAERIAISDDNTEIYYSEVKKYYPTTSPRIKTYKYSGDQWRGPYTLFENFLAPALSLNDDTMFFQNGNFETYISLKQGSNWDNPKRILTSLNTAHYFQVTAKHNYFLSSKPAEGIGNEDWCKLSVNGTDTTAISLGLPLNSGAGDLDFFISRDETFMIVSNAIGLCVSYHKDDDSWTNPKSLGQVINFGLGMWGPYVSRDNKYLFYSTGTKQDYSDVSIYWARIDGLIDSLKHTNFIPYVKTKIEDQSDTVGNQFNFPIPDNTFIDDDGNSTLTHTAKLINGKALPSWLAFDTINAVFSGKPDSVGKLEIRVTAKDNAGASVSTTFKITVSAANTIEQPEENKIKISPNPSSGLIYITSNEYADRTGVVLVTNMEGKAILRMPFKNNLKLDLGAQPKGAYILSLLYDNQRMFRKFYLK